MTQEEIKEYVYGKNKKTNYFYYVLSTKSNDGKMFAYATRVSEHENLLPIIKNWGDDYLGDVVFVQQCKTLKRAEEIATAWNESYKQNGTYLFDKSR